MTLSSVNSPKNEFVRKSDTEPECHRPRLLRAVRRQHRQMFAGLSSSRLSLSISATASGFLPKGLLVRFTQSSAHGVVVNFEVEDFSRNTVGTHRGYEFNYHTQEEHRGHSSLMLGWLWSCPGRKAALQPGDEAQQPSGACPLFDVMLTLSTGIHAVIRSASLQIRSRSAGAYHGNFRATAAEANVGRGAVVGIVGLQEPVVGICDHADSVASIP